MSAMFVVRSPSSTLAQLCPAPNRQPNHVDEPEIEPSKLFRVERIKPIKGNPFWEKRILKQLGVGDLVVSIRIGAARWTTA